MELESSYVDVIILVPGKSFSQDFIFCWTETIKFLYDAKLTYYYSFNYSPIISELRNTMVGQDPACVNPEAQGRMSVIPSKIPFSGKLRAQKVIFIDSDMIWSLEDFRKLLYSDENVISGIYCFSDIASSSSIVELENNTAMLATEIITERTEPFPIIGGGLGFTAVKFEVLENITYPWFSHTEEIRTDANGKPFYYREGEDFSFFRKAKEAGYQPMADPTILVGHEKPKVFRIK